MPIYSLEGTPGSGKTLYCVQKIIPEFLGIRDSDGNLVPRHIYTNIEGLRPEFICSLLGLPYHAISSYFHRLGYAVDDNGNEYEDKDLVRYWYYKPETIEWVEDVNDNKKRERHPNFDKVEMIPLGSLVIIDEIQNYYSNRDFATIYSKRCIDFVTKNRHYGWSLWWMSQSVESVDVTFRRNTEYVYFLERRDKYGSKNTASVKMYEGWLAGNKTNMPPFATKKFAYDSRFFVCYNSYVKKGIKEKRYSTNIFLAHKGFCLIVILFVLVLIYAICSDPIATISNTKHKPRGTSGQTPAAASFSGGGSSSALGSSSSGVCVQNTYTMRGENYVIYNNGKTEKMRGGYTYEICR